MSSGFGTNGGRGRCFPFWQEFAKCAVGTDTPQKDCVLALEDYSECLYHRKEIARVKMVRDQYIKNQLTQQQQGEGVTATSH